MTLKKNYRQNKQLKRGVYGLFALVITIFASILTLIQLQHNEQIHRENLDNDYHLAISKYSLELLTTIDKARLWFRDQELIHLKRDIASRDTPNLSPLQSELRSQGQTNKLKIKIKRTVEKIFALQTQYADPEFITVTQLLKQAHIKTQTGLDEIISTGLYSSQRLDRVVALLTTAAIQVQRQHQNRYHDMFLSYETFQSKKRLHIIALVIALTIAGFIGVCVLFRHVRNTLIKLANTQNELQHERDFSSNLITTAPVIILLLGPKGKIQHVNPYFEQLTGYCLSEIKGKEWVSSFLTTPDQDRLRKILQNPPPDISVRGKSNPIITRSGEVRDIEWSAETMHDASGTITGILSIGMDITDRKKTEKELGKYRHHLEELVKERTAEMELARDEAQQASSAKSKFLSHMSHELRTPMNAILGFAQMLKLDADNFDQTQRSNIEEIIGAGHHLLQLINELLDLTRVESGKMDVTLSRISVDDILQKCLSLIEGEAEIRHIKIIDNISGKGYFLLADATRLKQILLNLLSNAIKYNREHGQIVLDARIINKNRLRLYVIDNGKGLNQAEINQLFTSFGRLDPTNNVEGTGIGLVITKHLIELMGGTISVESVPGEGCMFQVELALSEGA